MITYYNFEAVSKIPDVLSVRYIQIVEDSPGPSPPVLVCHRIGTPGVVQPVNNIPSTFGRIKNSQVQTSRGCLSRRLSTATTFAFGETVEISGTINGDLYASGGQVVIAGSVNGDVLVAGGRVSLSGTVSQDVRAAGGQIAITGNVGRNLTLAGGNVEIASSAAVRHGVVAARPSTNSGSHLDN